MKNSKVNFNLENLKRWYHEANFVINEFESIINDLELTLVEVSVYFTKFRGRNSIITFHYDVNRYGGRILEDILVKKGEEEIRLSLLVYQNENIRQLHKLINERSKKHIPPIRVFKELFSKHLYDYISQANDQS